MEREDWGHRTEREKEREIDVKREVTYAPAKTCRDKVAEWRVAITAGQDPPANGDILTTYTYHSRTDHVD